MLPLHLDEPCQFSEAKWLNLVKAVVQCLGPNSTRSTGSTCLGSCRHFKPTTELTLGSSHRRSRWFVRTQIFARKKVKLKRTLGLALLVLLAWGTCAVAQTWTPL